jgi:hypothetical protein
VRTCEEASTRESKNVCRRERERERERETRCARADVLILHVLNDSALIIEKGDPGATSE